MPNGLKDGQKWKTALYGYASCKRTDFKNIYPAGRDACTIGSRSELFLRNELAQDGEDLDCYSLRCCNINISVLNGNIDSLRTVN